jgi:serine/threonine protein kinase
LDGDTLPPVDADATADEGLPAVHHTSAVVPIDPWRALAQWADEEGEDDSTWRAMRRRNPQESIGRVIGRRYRLGEVIGVGGMGTVFEAVHTGTGKRVAMKVLALAFDQDEGARERFRREAMTASSLDSEFIAQVFDVGEDIELGLYMVMECLTGADLARSLAERGPLPPAAAVRVAWQVCLALEHAHAAGVVHRDLKPANVFLSEDDGSIAVKVLDFGIAKQVIGSGPAEGEGVIVGTPRYMSPEQARGAASVNHLTDLYSLGAVLFEAISGASPYPRLTSSRETLAMIQRCDPPRLAAIVPGVPAAVDALVAELMARDPAQRPESARAVRHRLAAIASQLEARHFSASGPPPSVPAPAPVVMPAATSTTSLGGTRRAYVAAALVLGVLLVAALATLVR